MPAARHCRHCLGDCPGDCLIGISGRCIGGLERPSVRDRFARQQVLTRKWWHRVFSGIGYADRGRPATSRARPGLAAGPAGTRHAGPRRAAP